MRIAVWIAAVAVIAGADSDAPKRPAAAVARCGHLAEVEAAKQALERGDREDALRHLEAADALLQKCEKEGIPTDTSPASPPTQTGGVEENASASVAGG